MWNPVKAGKFLINLATVSEIIDNEDGTVTICYTAASLDQSGEMQRSARNLDADQTLEFFNNLRHVEIK